MKEECIGLGRSGAAGARGADVEEIRLLREIALRQPISLIEVEVVK